VVHARGAAAHGVFQVYDDSLSEYTVAKVLTDPSLKTPVFVRFSTVAGSRGSADTARDVRGFAVKMYTPEGNWDLVGNNIPVFFIQDAIKFPDLIHSVKPEPNNEFPQASSAHDTFYDFLSLTPESMHMLMWIMSDRAIPPSTGQFVLSRTTNVTPTCASRSIRGVFPMRLPRSMVTRLRKLGPSQGWSAIPKKSVARKFGNAAQVSKTITGRRLFSGTARHRWRSITL
jgi:hypothetical protein